MTSFLRLYFNRLLPQLIALGIIVAAVSLVFPGFLNLQIQNGRLYGSLIDILNRGAPVVLLAIGMTVVIATKGIDLSVARSWRSAAQRPPRRSRRDTRSPRRC